MKKSAVLTVALVLCLVALAAGAWSIFGRSVSLTYAHAESYTAGGTTLNGAVENLDIHWTDGKVNIEYHADNTVVIAESSRKAIPEDRQLRWWLDGTTLHIQYDKGGLNFLSFDSLDKTLTLTLPENIQLKDVSIGATSGDLSIPRMSADTLNLSTTSGGISAAADVRALSAACTSGDQDIRLAGSTETVKVGTTSGNIAISLENAGKVAIGATSGDIRLTQTGTTDEIDVGTTSGTIRVSANTVGSCKIGSTSGNTELTAAQLNKAEIAATSGSITVRTDAFSSLNVTAVSGNVTAHLPAEPGFSGEIATVSGSVVNQIALTKSGKNYVCGDGSGSIAIHTTSGSISIEP